MKAIEKTKNEQRVWVVQTTEGAGLGNFYASIIRAMRRVPTTRRDLMAKEEQLHHLLTQMKPSVLMFDEFHNIFRGRKRDIEAVFACLRRLGREHNIASVLVGEVAIDDHINATDEMGSRVDLCPIPRWQMDDEYLSLLDALESAIPLANPSGLAQPETASTIFALSEGLIGEIVGIVTAAAVLAVQDGGERITVETVRRLNYVPLSKRRANRALRDRLT